MPKQAESLIQGDQPTGGGSDLLSARLADQQPQAAQQGQPRPARPVQPPSRLRCPRRPSMKAKTKEASASTSSNRPKGTATA